MVNSDRRILGWLRANWIEILLVLLLAAALIWIFQTGRQLLQPADERTTSLQLQPTTAPGPPPATQAAPAAPVLAFSGQQAQAFVAKQVAEGPRPSGSGAALNTANWIAEELRRAGWEVEVQQFEHDGVPLRNVLARGGSGEDVVLLGTHFDTRPVADQDPDPAKRQNPVLGANGSASGVAVLLELARTLDRSLLDKQVWLAFFDGGDHAEVDEWPPSVGATYFAQNLNKTPQTMVLVNVVGASDQRFLYDPNSDAEASAQVWRVADDLGYANWFVPQPGQALVDDHLPFARELGVPVVAIVGSDYPYRHTTEDTPSMLSAESMERVGRVLEAFIEGDSGR